MARLTEILIFLFVLNAIPARADGIALLIGNGGYTDAVGPLRNPPNDVDLIEKAIKRDGFLVTKIKDASRNGILRAVRQFASKLVANKDTVGVFYYSGHGAARSDDGVNYLIPTSIKSFVSDDDFSDAVSLDEIIHELKRAPEAAKIIIIDACRNELHLATKSLSKGFSTGYYYGQNLAIEFSTAPNQTASDVGTLAGPYATELAAELVRTRQSSRDLFDNVRRNVWQLTGHKQTPYQQSSLLTSVFFDPNIASLNNSAEPETQQACPTFVSKMEQNTQSHSGPTVTVNFVLLDAYKGCYITRVSHNIIKQYNFSKYTESFEKDRRLVRISFQLFDKPTPGFAKIDFTVEQAQIR